MAFELFDAEGRIHLNDSEVSGGLENLKRKVRTTMDEIRGMRAEAQIRADMSDLQRKEKEAVAALRELDRMDATAKAKLSTVEFDAKKAELERKIDELKMKRIEITAELRYRQGAVNSVISDFRKLRQDANDTSTALEKVKGWFSKIGSEPVNLGPVNLSISTLLAGSLALGPILSSLVGTVGALAAAIGAGIVGAAAVGGAALTGFGLNALGAYSILKQALQPLSEVQKLTTALTVAQEKYGASSTQAKTAQQQLNQALAQMDPHARAAAKALSEVTAEWTKLTRPARNDIYATIASGLTTLRGLLPQLSTDTNNFVKTFDIGLRGAFEWLRGNEARGAIHTLMASVTDALPGALHGIGQLAIALERVFVSASRFIKPVVDDFNQWAIGVARATGNSSTLDLTMNKLAHSAADVWHFLTAAATALVHLLAPGVGAGDSLIERWTRDLNKFSASNNSDKLTRFYNDSVHNFNLMTQALGPLITALAHWNQALAPIAPVLLHMIDGLAQVIKWLSQLPGFTQVIQGLVALFVADKILTFAAAIGKVVSGLRELATVRSIGDLGGMLKNFVGGKGGKVDGSAAAEEIRAAMVSGGEAAAAEIRAAMTMPGHEGSIPGGGTNPASTVAKDAQTAGEGAAGGFLARFASKIKAGLPGALSRIGLAAAIAEFAAQGFDALKKSPLWNPPGGHGSFWDNLIPTGIFGKGHSIWDILFGPKNTPTAPKINWTDFTQGAAQATGQVLSSIHKLESTPLPPKVLQIVEHGGPQAVAAVQRLLGIHLTPKEQRIVENGGAQAVALIRVLQGMRLAEKTQQIKQAGAGAVQAALHAINAFTLPGKQQTVSLQDNASAGLRAIATAVGSIPSVKTVTIAVQQVGKMITGAFATGGVVPAYADGAAAVSPRKGGLFSRPTFLVGDHQGGGSEVVISPDPAAREQNKTYWRYAARMLGVPGFALGGVLSGYGFSGAPDTSNVPHQDEIDKAQRKVDDENARYSSMDRRYNILTPDLLNPDGTRNEGGIAEHVRQLDSLIAQKQRVEDAIRNLQYWVETAIKSIHEAIKNFTHEIAHMTHVASGMTNPKSRKKAYEVIGQWQQAVQQYQGFLPNLLGERQTVKWDLDSAYLDVLDLEHQRAAVKGTEPTTTPFQLGETALEGALALAGLTPGAADDTTALNQLIAWNRAEVTSAEKLLSDNDPTNDYGAWQRIITATGNIQNFQSQLAGGAGGAGSSAGIVSDQASFASALGDLYTQFGGNVASAQPPSGAQVNVTQSFAAPPDDPHSWSQQLVWELQAVL